MKILLSSWQSSSTVLHNPNSELERLDHDTANSLTNNKKLAEMTLVGTRHVRLTDSMCQAFSRVLCNKSMLSSHILQTLYRDRWEHSLIYVRFCVLMEKSAGATQHIPKLSGPISAAWCYWCAAICWHGIESHATCHFLDGQRLCWWQNNWGCLLFLAVSIWTEHLFDLATALNQRRVHEPNDKWLCFNKEYKNKLNTQILGTD